MSAQPAIIETAPVPGVVRPAGQPGVRSFGFALFLFLVLAFAYEIPLVYLTPYYRLNPRLFDVAAALLAVYWVVAGNWKLSLENPLLKPWAALTGLFVFAALVSYFWLPTRVWGYSLFYAARYVEGLTVLLITLSAPFSERQKRALLRAALLGGVWVGFYALLQQAGVVSIVRVLPQGDEIRAAEQGIYSTLGPAYFHTGQFGVISGLVALTLFQARGRGRTLALLTAPLCVAPAVISGSRAGLVGLVLAVAFVAIQRPFRNQLGTYLAAPVLAAAVVFFFSTSFTRERIEVSELSGGNSVAQRVMYGPLGIAKLVEEHGAKLFAVGGGFMVVPIDGQFRIGYGIHNIFLFPLEQAGLLAWFVSFWFWIRVTSALVRARADPRECALDTQFRTAMCGYMGALLLVGVGGQVFYLGFGTENLTFYQLLMFGLALKPTGQADAPQPAPRAFPGVDPPAALRPAAP